MGHSVIPLRENDAVPDALCGSIHAKHGIDCVCRRDRARTRQAEPRRLGPRARPGRRGLHEG
jgi:hypothetical protein